ncbi:glycosyltransferase [Xanthobacter dioxanivorans]|uniref:Glycosyltransferase n=1 Tax=Xanthobacter dioxanivorans TaxID=2528964 RepID=A0A974PS59_9HYPH|nr:glycosyltransferase family 2 protein [Xanthobacter dioxanivorans]QRG08762.1 glycosyltransferase [Xanthobacter dioxanivorans]
MVEEDDAGTRAAIAAEGLPPHMEELAVPPVGPRTKPKALDVALPFARGTFVAIYDAEDLPEPDQLRRALEAFRAGGPSVACVQARLCVDNGEDSWISGHFAAEYAGQFDVLMPMLSALGLPILLGGTSNHFRRRVLEEVGAWDPFNVTEDADLGIRLARAGWATRVIASTTYEEAPVTSQAWLGQRTRWLKGWAQTLLVHSRSPRVLVRDLGARGTLALGVLTAGPFAAALVHPFCLALFAGDVVRGVVGLPCDTLAEVLTSALTYSTLAAGYAGSAVTAVAGLRRRGLPVRWWIILTIPAYWLLLSVAAWRAVGELVRRPHFWRKTEHGLGRRRGPAREPAREPANDAFRSSASAPPQRRPAAAWN